MDQMRSWLKPASRRSSRRTRLLVEPLEQRDTPSITTSGNPPVWETVGPVAIDSGSNLILGSAAKNIQIGAIESVAVDPFNSAHVLIGSINGGLWLTNDYTDPTPTWTPTTDALPSQSISSISYSPLTPGLVFAGTGSYSAGGLGPNFSAGVNNPGDGGASVGLYRSTDGGNTWIQLGTSVFSGLRIRDVIPTRLNNGGTVFVAVHDSTGPNTTGIYRSDDYGVNWTRLSGANGLPDLGVTSLIADAGNPNRFYAAPVGGAGAGVYMLDVTGGNSTWLNVSTNLPSAVALGSRILLASTAAGVDPVFAAVVAPTGIPQGVYRAVPFGTNYVWTAIGPGGLPPDVSVGQQGDVHFAIAADPTSDRLVYVAGDRRTSFPYAGNVARGDAIANTWTTMTFQDTPPPPATPGTVTPSNPPPQPATAPHPDFRWLAFAGNDTILAGTDGGIYQVTNPRAFVTAPVWSSVNGNLRISELYMADLDNGGTPADNDDVYMAAAQDNGESEAQLGGLWSEIQTGDGTIVLADSVNRFRYYSAQSFFVTRRNPDATLVQPAGIVNGSGGKTLNAAAPGVLIEFLPFNTTTVLNQRDTNQILVGGFQTLYLSTDHMDTFTSIGGITGGNANPVPNITSTVTAIAFGNTFIPNAAYVATDDGNIARSFDITSGNGNFVPTNFSTVAGGSAASGIVMDPNNPLIAYAVANNGVYQTIDGTNWTNITASLATQVQAGGLTKLFSIALFNNGTATTTDDVLLVGGYAGVYALRLGQSPTEGCDWVKFGGGMPNVVVSSLRYDAVADTLVAGTFGRGAYRLKGVSTALNNKPTITVTGTIGANTMAIYPDPNDLTKFIVTDGLGNTQTFGANTYQAVVFQGLGGSDTIRVGSPNDSVLGRTFPLTVDITANGGGQNGDTLIIDDRGDTVGRQGTLTPTTFGSGVGDNIFSSCGSVDYTGFNDGSVQVRFGTGDDLFAFDDSASKADTGYTLSATRLTRSLGGIYDYSGADRMVLTGSDGNNSYNITATGASTTVEDGIGSSTMNVQGNALTGAYSIFRGNDGNDLITLNAGTGFTTQVHASGGTGNDGVAVVGRTAFDLATIAVNDGAGGGTLSGLGFNVTFDSSEGVLYSGNGGGDTLNWIDNTNGGYGTPTDPAGGVVVSATGPSAGRLLVARGAVLPGVSFNGVLNFGVNGDGNGSGDPDVLMVLGTSTAGNQSAFGEATATEGRDIITASDQSITIKNVSSGGPSIAVTPLDASTGATTFGTIYVATGNETGSSGDRVTAVPSSRVNLLIDGMNPTRSPGDKITIQAPGPFTTAVLNDPAVGPTHTRYTQVTDGSSVGILNFEGVTTSGGSQTSGMIVVGSDAGTPARVQVYDRRSGAFRYEFQPFGSFSGGVSVASGDMNGDGVADTVIGAGPTGGPRVAVFSGVDGSYLYDFFGYEDDFRGGVNVAVADMNGDGAADLILGTGPSGGPRVRILDGRTLNPILDRFAYDINFRGGVRVATGDFNKDGIPDLITSTGVGGGPQVVVRDGATFGVLSSFFVFDPDNRNGFFVSSGDVNGDGVADIIAGSGPNDPARIRAFSGQGGSLLADFFMNDPFNPTQVPFITKDVGVRVASADVDGDGIDDIITAKGPGSNPTIRTYGVGFVNPLSNAVTINLRQVREQNVFEPTFGFGIFVGASN